MLTHLLALAGLVALCVVWVLFQRWLARQDPERGMGFRPGCGACGGRASCRKPEERSPGEHQER